MPKQTTTETPLTMILLVDGKKPTKLTPDQETKLKKYVERMTKTKVVYLLCDDRNAETHTN